ncbi:hypothetical protein ACQEWB_19425 [Streptomyces sp. CA-249302]|uniref:hypothetical protein n=1 Tax=Streptomyces sp. CA-249302 TaxID=3240058 RepID=UPI003D93B00E
MDTRQYVAHAYMLQGVGREEASRRALEYYCDSARVAAARRANADLATYRNGDGGNSAYRKCVAAMEHTVEANSQRTDVTGYMALFSDPRISGIFATRPAYPAFTIPFVRAFGLVRGLWAAGVAVTVLAGGLVVLTLRRLGVSVPLALLGQVLYYALPTGTDSMQPMCEGLLLCVLLGGVLGCVRILQGRIPSGVAISLAAFGAAACVKYAQTLLAVAGIAGMTALFVFVRWVRRREFPRPEWVLLATTAAFVIALQLVIVTLGLPSTRASVQELMSVHYNKAVPPHLLHEFLRLNLAFWREWLRDALVQPLGLLLLAAGAWGALRHHRSFGFLIVGIAAAGFVNQAGHPEVAMGPRLLVMASLLPVCGIPLLIESRTGRQDGKRGQALKVLPPRGLPAPERQLY